MSDLNALFSISACGLPVRGDMPRYSYPVIPDAIPNPNDNGRMLLGVCVDEKLLVVNNLETPRMQFKGGLTYRQGQVWVSELDSCLISHEYIDKVESFEIIQDLRLPSNHAPYP